MTKEKKPALSKTEELVPELRFPEFISANEWIEKDLGDLINIKGRIGYRGYTKNDIVKKGEGAVSVSPSNIDENGIFNLDKSTYITWAKYEESPEIILQEGYSLLVKTGSTYGKVAFIKNLSEKATINPQLVVLKPMSIDSFFLYLVVSNTSVQNQIKATVVGGAIPTLSQNSISKFKVVIPPDIEEKEQKKIASCLSSLDELITVHSDKLEALKGHKKGLMQNLFPQKGQKIPNYRFPEFEKDGEWVEKELSEVAEIVTGNTPSTKKSKYYGGEMMFASPADISENRYVEKTKTTLTSLGFSKTRHIKANSILFVCIGSTIGKIAQNKLTCATNQQINSLMPNKENSSDFLYSNLEQNSTKIAELAGNQAVPIINKSLFSSVKLLFPSKFEEQQKIASCFSSLDELITAQSEKIEQLQQHKKGLMQGLFPKK